MPALEKEKLPDFATARFNMIEGQVRPNKVTDRRLLDAMNAIPRETFLPQLMAGIAYNDTDIQLAPGRYLMQPMVLARLLQEAFVKPEDRVLDIAPGTGYSTAVIAALAKEVVGVESDPELQRRAETTVSFLGCSNAEVRFGFHIEGCKEKSPFDVILINGSIDAVPETLLEQLGETGRLVAVVRRYGPGQAAHTGEARLYQRIHGAISMRQLFDANIKPLPGFQVRPRFSFEGS